jgi:hypothetical protein
MRYGLMLAVVTSTTISVTATTPAAAQSICYRPDGSMYIGRQAPTDCSPTRPKSRDEDVQRRIQEEAAGRAERDAARRAKEAEEHRIIRRAEERQIEDEARDRVLSQFASQADKANARKAILACDTFKTRPVAMNAEQSALCNQYWQEKARRALRNR